MAIVGAALVVSHDDLTADWFSDEMWRANFVRSPRWWDLYLSWDTPTAPGFIGFHRLAVLVGPDGPFALRLWTLGWLVVTLILTLVLLLDVVAREPVVGPPRVDLPGRSASLRVAAVAAVVVMPLVAALGVHRTFVPYFLETAVAAALITGVSMLDRRPAVWPWLLATVVVTPVLAIGTVLLLPAVAWYVLAWARRQPDRRSRTIWTVGALAASAGAGLVVYATAYRPVRKASIDHYWAGAVLDSPGRFDDLVVDTLRQLREGVLAWAHPGWLDHPRLVGLALAGCFVTGAASLGRRWPPLLVFVVSGWVAIVAASAVAGWPMTAERVNLPVYFLVFVMTVFGAVRILSVATRELVPVTVVAGVLIAVVLWPRHEAPLFGDAFLRGLTDDLQVVEASPAAGNVVVTYHFASRWYAEDALVTHHPPGRSFELRYETYADRSVYDPEVLAAAADDAGPGGMVWCVMPFDIGPADTERACAVPDGLVRVVDVRGQRSVIRGYRVP